MRCAKKRRYRVHSSIEIQAFALQLQRRRTELKTFETIKSPCYRIRLYGGCLPEDRFESLESLVA